MLLCARELYRRAMWSKHTMAHYYRHHETMKARGRASELRRRLAGKVKITRWVDLTPEQQARMVARAIEWKSANRDRVRASKKKHYSPLEGRRWQQLRLARKRAAPGTFTAAHIRTLYRDQDGCCLYCGAGLSSGFHIDHMTPLSRGGSNWPCNLALACAGCNLRKWNRTAEEFIEREDPIAEAA